MVPGTVGLCPFNWDHGTWSLEAIRTLGHGLGTLSLQAIGTMGPCPLLMLTRTHCAYVQKFKRMRTGYVTADFLPSTHTRNQMWVCPALFFEAVYLPSSGRYRATQC